MGKLLLTFFLLGASLIGCQDKKQYESTYPEELIGAWIHSHEDDTQEVKVYRPASYDFPPSRGREGFNLMEGGECIYYGIAPADGSTNEPASWSWADGSMLTIKRKAEGAPEMVMEVVSVGEDMLKVKK
ncbi:MAG: hypothetical protein KDD19_04475 [Phaeodactylibacter sp.]|nr:hypothetical protein [Phaeodactylibacter sp.]MCB9049677.1 hypothetical protein [Lewinellaceae bacterium]